MASMDRIIYYQTEVANMQPEELSKHLREDYTHEIHVWPDYLDYIEEWEHAFEKKLKQTRKDFIYSFLARRNQRIQCKDHTHQFCIREGEGDILITDPDQYMEATSCWYQTIIDEDESITKIDPQAGSARLSVPEATIIKRMSHMKLLLHDGLTYDKLSFQDFKDLWWTKESKANALKIYEKTHVKELIPPAEIIEEARKELKEPKPIWFSKPTTEVEVILDISKVLNDHGFHIFIQASKDPKFLFDLISEIRVKGSNDISQRLDYDIFLHAVTHCSKCHMTKTNVYQVTETGLYYAPPGNGKTTAIEEGIFIGVDTDWLLRGSNYKTIVEPFISRNIPVITNQYHLATNAGEKMIGMYNHRRLRTDLYGKPWTSLPEILAAQKVMGDDIVILHVNGYFSQHILKLLRAKYCYELTRRTFMDKSEGKKFKIPKHKKRVYTDLLHLATTWASYTKRQIRAKRSKFKKKIK